MNVNTSISTPLAPASSRRYSTLFPAGLFLIIVTWCSLLWLTTRPESIVKDWKGWRQADTQAIALNFLHDEMNILYPRIDWRGDGPGYVETEFQLYPFLIAIGMTLFGTGIWQGQLLSLLSLAGAAVYIALLCRRYFSDVAALLGTAAFLGCLGTLHLATAVQPDAFSFFFYSGSIYYFSKYIDTGSLSTLTAAFAYSTLAALIKPPALHLGIIQFIWICFAAPRRLRSPWLWLHWGLILAVMTVFYHHAHQLYQTYGNTFGIGIGGDSKFPGLGDLSNPKNYVKIVLASITWGFTGIGALAGVLLLLTRKINVFEIAASAGIGIMLVVAMRYTSYVWFGSHYHIYTAILGSYFLAHSLQLLPARRQKTRAMLSVLLLCYLVTAFAFNIHRRINHTEREYGRLYERLGQEAAAVMNHGKRIIVRADAPAQVEGWQQGTNNYEDPRIFYLTAQKGWVIPNDFDDIKLFEQYVQQGAEYYIQPAIPSTPLIAQWLEEHGTLLSKTEYGFVYALN